MVQVKGGGGEYVREPPAGKPTQRREENILNNRQGHASTLNNCTVFMWPGVSKPAKIKRGQGEVVTEKTG